jgi:hypothetical protein
MLIVRPENQPEIKVGTESKGEIYFADDSFTIHLGGCDDGRANCLPLAGDGFYYQWRMYEPGEAILRREFSFNLPEEVK